ncbi:MAG: hypothetical protein MUC62_09510 [Candidatus Thermoplasmatota archaeon]|jgi:hypothetical protein|nr:hypothetical protein [Candidatus Thermoplasmatota archaeon]
MELVGLLTDLGVAMDTSNDEKLSENKWRKYWSKKWLLVIFISMVISTIFSIILFLMESYFYIILIPIIALCLGALLAFLNWEIPSDKIYIKIYLTNQQLKDLINVCFQEYGATLDKKVKENYLFIVFEKLGYFEYYPKKSIFITNKGNKTIVKTINEFIKFLNYRCDTFDKISIERYIDKVERRYVNVEYQPEKNNWNKNKINSIMNIILILFLIISWTLSIVISLLIECNILLALRLSLIFGLFFSIIPLLILLILIIIDYRKNGVMHIPTHYIMEQGKIFFKLEKQTYYEELNINHIKKIKIYPFNIVRILTNNSFILHKQIIYFSKRGVNFMIKMYENDIILLKKMK